MADFARPNWPHGNGEMVRRIRETDWSRTSLGPIEGWPQSLKTVVDLMLASGHAMRVAWGPDQVTLYNDAYAPTLGDRHPGALGLPQREAWPDAWDEIAPLIDRVFAGETVRYEAFPLVLTRHGYPEQTWWNFSYSPIRDESGAVAGLLNVTIDATAKIRADRAETVMRESEERQALLLRLTDALRPLHDPLEVQQVTADIVGSLLDTGWAYFGEFHADSNDMVVRADYVRPGRTSVVGTHPIGSHEIWRELLAGHTVAIPDIETSPLFSEASRKRWSPLGMRSIVAVPIVKQGYFAGALVVADDQPRDWDGHVATLKEAGERAWAALERAHAEAAMRDSEARFRALATTGALNIFRMSADWRYLYQLDSETLAPTDEPVEDWAERYVVPEDLPGLRASVDAAIRNKSLFEHEHRVFQADGTIGWILSRAVPLLNAQGEITEWFGAGTDVTEPHRVAEQRERRERDALFLDQIGIDLARLSDPDEIMDVVGARAGAYLGLTGCVFCDVDEARHEVSIHYGWNSDRVPSLKQTFELDHYVTEAFWAAGRDGETFITRDTGHDDRVSAPAYRELQVGAFVVVPFFSRGRWTSYFGATDSAPRDWSPEEVGLIEEVAERLFARVERARAELALRDSERRLRILVAELQHRVRNILTVVRSVFDRTVAADGGADDIVDNFRGRLGALARAQTFVTQDSSRTADLRTLIADALRSVGAGEGPLVTLTGPQVTLHDKQAETLGLAIHELTTNALKHGALKIAEARLDIGWTVDAGLGGDARLGLIWAEHGVPGVRQPPDHPGFGRELIERVLPYRLGAETRLQFLENGVRCTLSLPLPASQEAGPQRP